MLRCAMPSRISASRARTLSLAEIPHEFFIADLDSPRGGVIRVSPQNLVSLAESLSAQ